MKKLSGVYALIENRPGHRLFGQPRYIGQSKCMAERWVRHLSNFRRRKDNKYRTNTRLNILIQKHVEAGAALNWQPLVVCAVEHLDRYEMDCIKVYRDTIVNTSEGGKRNDTVMAGRISGKKTGVVNGKLNGKRSHESGDLLKASRLGSAKGGAATKEKQSYLKAIEASNESHANKRNEKLVAAGFYVGYKPSMAEARQHKLTRFYGNVCEVHPESEGERFTSSNKCVACHRERLQRYKENKQNA